jgi:hypothetical protein
MMNTPFLQVHVNKSVCDRFSATWSLNRGHHLFIYQRSRSQATVTSDVIERFRQSINNDADIFHDCDSNKTDEGTFNDHSKDNEGDEKNESESDINCKDEPSSSSSSSTTSRSDNSNDNNNYKKNKRNNKSFVAVSKRVHHAESMFVSLFRLFPGNLLSSKSSSGSGNDSNRQ